MTMKMKTQYRSFAVPNAINEESRTVEIAFSSEEAVERYFGTEILDHRAESIRLGRLEGGAPLLVDHDPTDHIGTVESVSIGSDKVGRAIVRFGKSARANEIFTDVVDGIRKHISVGYRIHKMVEDAKNVFRAVDWEPLEVSFVSIPADASVGVGRELDEEFDVEVQAIEPEKTEEKRSVEMTTEKKIETPVVDVKAERADAQKQERDRVSTIADLGERFAANDLARDFISSGKSADKFREALLERQEKNEAVGSMGTTPETNLDLSDKEVRQYSMLRAINAAATGDWSKAEFERECSLAIAEKLDRDARGFFVPFDVQTRVTPPMNTTDQGNLVGTDHLAGSFIEQLRNQSVVLRLGGRMLSGLVGNVDIPKQTAGSTFAWLAEDADATDSDLTIGQVTLSPKTIGGAIPITRRLLKQGTPDAEMLARSDLIAGAALAIDLGALSGSGAAGQPTGILNSTGINTQTVTTAGQPTFTEMVGFETAVLTDNALMGALNYVSTPAVQGHMKTTFIDAGSGLRIQQDGRVNGYPVTATNQMGTNSILFGNFNDVIIGMWGVLDLSVDVATKAASGGIVVRAFQDIDVAVRHAESFCKNA